MKILICGAGIVGSGIAKHLAQDNNNDVVVIDQDQDNLNRLSSSVDIKTIHGLCSDPNILHEAGADNIDVLIAITVEDELNMITCQIAKTLFDVPLKIARIRNQSYLEPKWEQLFGQQQLPIDIIISPELEVANSIINRLHAPGSCDMFPIAKSNCKVTAVKLTERSVFLNKDWGFFQSRTNDLDLSIICIVQDDKVKTPAPEFTFRKDDEIYFIANNANTKTAMSLFGHEEKEAHKILIVGGGNIGYHIAKRFEDESETHRIKLIEVGTERAEYIAEHLRDTLVINGSALEEEILHEANIKNTETIIAVTNDDEVNILASLLAKKNGCRSSVALINSMSFGPIIGNLGIDVVVNPRETTTSTILGYIRRGKIKGVHTIHDGAGEVLEVDVLNGMKIIGKNVSELDLKQGINFAALIRDGELVKITSETVINEGDRAIIYAASKHNKAVEKLFAG